MMNDLPHGFLCRPIIFFSPWSRKQIDIYIAFLGPLADSDDFLQDFDLLLSELKEHKKMGDTAKPPLLLLTRKFETTASADHDDGSVKDNEPHQNDKQQHSKLTKSILKLSKKKDKRKQNSEQRTEFAPKVSEFTFKGGAEGSVKVDIRDLSRPLTLSTKSKDAKQKKKIEESDAGEEGVNSNAAADDQPVKTDKKGSAVHREVRGLKARKPTRAPLVKHKEEKLLRQVGYNVAVDEVKEGFDLRQQQ